MSASLAIAIAIPWVFWGVLMGFLIKAGRSWLNMLLIPVGSTVVILVIASLTTDRSAFWASLILHLFLLVLFIRSYLAFVLGERIKNR